MIGLETGEGGEPGRLADEPGGQDGLGRWCGVDSFLRRGGCFVPHRPQKPAPSSSGVPQLPQNLAMVAPKEHLPTCKRVVSPSPDGVPAEAG